MITEDWEKVKARVMKHKFNKMWLVPRSLFTYLCWRRMQLFFLIVVATITNGCFQQYYKTNSRTEADTTTIQQLKAANKYFIIHFPDNIMAAKNLQVANEMLEADLQALPQEHAKYISPMQDDQSIMKVKYKATTLTEVHLYTDEGFSAGQMHIALPVADINRMDIYELDAKTTKQNRVLSIIGVAVGAYVVAAIILVIADPPVNF